MFDSSSSSRPYCCRQVTSALYLALGAHYWPRLELFSKLSDVLMLLHYVIDPLIYVLSRKGRRCSVGALCHAIAHCFKRKHKTSTDSMKTSASCCPQETLIISDSSGAELRPLRPGAATLLQVDE
ncbi:unnamed protein product [Leptidea sinapis]|uniref:Uncharacterized protein n=1 Tax=Leptidea sinapis TaxID=189913 RepID=A0A5E4QA09_9NEOP|nr:unnamed protein product [Leptidea sinapis]